MPRKFIYWVGCHILNDHDWTCRAKEGLGVEEQDKPQETDSDDDIQAKFLHYARMYCRQCGKVHELK